MAGKKGKSKNHRERRQGQQFNQSHQRQQVNVSQVACSLCAAPSEAGENFVQCDECKLDFHFKCVGITNIGDEDEWRCNSCLEKNAPDPSTHDETSFVDLCDQSTINKPYDSSNEPLDNQTQTPTAKVKFVADIHQPRLEDVDENEIHQSQTPFYEHHQSTQSNFSNPPQPKFDAVIDDAHTDNQQSQSNDRQAAQSNGRNTQQSAGGTTYRSAQSNDRNTQKSTDDINRQSTQSVSRNSQGAFGNANKTNSVKSLIEGSIRSAKSISSISSSKELHLRHAKDQYELQERIDNEILDAKLEAIKAKEVRTKKLLEEIYKSKSERHSSSSSGSVKTSKSHVSTWVKDQQHRVESKSAENVVQSFPNSKDRMGMDLSISMNNTEIENIMSNRHTTDPTIYNQKSAETTDGRVESQWPIYDKSSKSDGIRMPPSSRSTILPNQPLREEQSTYLNVNSGNSQPRITLGKRLSVESRLVNPKTDGYGQVPVTSRTETHQSTISQNYNSMYPSYSEPYSNITHHATFNSNQPIYTSASCSNAAMNSNVTSSNNQAAKIQTLNNRTFPMYRMPTNNRPSLNANQIAARQAMPKWLPKFNGDPYDWPNFIKRYENSTILCGFCDDENLERLDKSLEGKAREIVRSQLMMPECVPEILQILFEKFGRPELVMKATLDSIRNEPTIKHDKLETLSNYGYKVHSACNIIEKLGLEYYLYNPELVQEILGKLPHQTKIDFAVYCENIEVVTLRTLANWMRALSRMINRISPIDAVFSRNSGEKNEDSKNSNNRNQSRKEDSSNSKSGYLNLHDANISSSPETRSECIICGNTCKHLQDCSKFKQLEVDRRWELSKQHNLCRRCLKQHEGDCQLSKECGTNGCVFKHNPLLHKDKAPRSKNPPPKTTKTSEAKIVNEPIKTGSNHAHFNKNEELFRLALVELHHNNQSFTTYAFLDEGSSFTLMERGTANKLSLTGTPETICLLWTKGIHRQEESEVVDLEISGKSIVNGKVVPTEKYPLRNVNIVDELDLPEQSLPMDEFTHKYGHLKKIPIIGYENARPTILIGVKNARLAVPLETVEGLEHEPIATRSRLGWQVYGTSKRNSTGFVNVHRVNKCPCKDRDEDLHKLVKDHFTVENFGVVANSSSLDSKENERALKLMKEHTIRKGNRFETKLLWKNDTYSLPDSYPMARKRLTCLENKGSKVIETINESITDYMAKGYVSKLTAQEATKTNKRTWYLPLFTVVHPKKPEKLRTVFDAAARVKGVSLNSVLFTGPDMSVSIVDMLRRFREHRIGVTGDLKEMYHQVTISEEDRNSQRFIWRYGDKNREPDTFVMNVMTFGATCSPSLAQFVKNLNASQFQDEYPRAAEAIINNHYVDDLLDGADSDEDAIQLLRDIKYVHKQGGFEIRNFKSNSSKVLEEIGEPNRENEKVSVDNENLERVLGMFWETQSDCFTFSLKYNKITSDVLTGRRVPTKRELLKILMSIFDPLGLLSHYLVHIKILIQDLWRSKIGWDQPIPANLESNWERWLKILPNVEKIKIPRWYSNKLSPREMKKVELHVFADAGAGAYSAVAYLRIEDREGVAVTLVSSKARVTPLKYLSNPRKELLASVLGTRLSNSIRDGLYTKVDRRIIWSDSINVLTWLQSEHQKYSQFVGHRIGEILESTELSEWRYIPTKQNVADEATKWTTTPTFESTNRWFSGPDFLKLPETEWPKQPHTIKPNGTVEEMRLSCLHSRLIMPSVVDIKRFSKWERVSRAVAYAIRWSKTILARVRKQERPKGPLTQEELSSAETLLFRQAQWEGFPNEMITLVRNSKTTKNAKQIERGSPIYDCSPYLDERGLLRVDGRLDKAATLPPESRRPIILPKNHPITRLIMLSYHVKMYHRNHETVINELRQRFYVPRVRVIFRSVRINCAMCKVKKCKPQTPLMADLPAIRFETGIRAFTYVGIDYFGPMSVMVGRRSEKRWGALFTCLTVRAIHIELVHSLDTQSCIMAIRNFINIRGRPVEIYSDNGSNFHGANNDLLKELQKLKVEKLGMTFTSCYTKWNFNPPETPHMGGLWERMIRTVKECLEESLTTRTPKEEVLHSLLIEISNVVNSRPLTFVPLDTCEDEALTPNHFILGTSNSLMPPGKFDNDGPYLRSAWKEIQRCTDRFWKRFINEYVPTLTRRSKWFENVKPLEVGDLVIDFNENSARNTYRRAKIVETIIGSRGQVRRAKVQYSNGNILWRPAVRLGVLDVNPQAPTEKESLDLTYREIKTGGTYVGATNQNVDKNFATTLSTDDNANPSFD